ncbi:hypothetical protein [Burkholderia seminalis]|uniref:hypothetical protein n=1 Tax=Burkholderia seminalis TaxID=488731 RepID=UPI00158F2048|nr:hypothetical protein [Burkholderia seminalis]
MNHREIDTRGSRAGDFSFSAIRAAGKGHITRSPRFAGIGNSISEMVGLAARPR